MDADTYPGWSVRGSGGWHAIVTAEPDPDAYNDFIVCGGVIVLRSDSDLRPTHIRAALQTNKRVAELAGLVG